MFEQLATTAATATVATLVELGIKKILAGLDPHEEDGRMLVVVNPGSANISTGPAVRWDVPARALGSLPQHTDGVSFRRLIEDRLHAARIGEELALHAREFIQEHRDEPLILTGVDDGLAIVAIQNTKERKMPNYLAEDARRQANRIVQSDQPNGITAVAFLSWDKVEQSVVVHWTALPKEGIPRGMDLEALCIKVSAIAQEISLPANWTNGIVVEAGKGFLALILPGVGNDVTHNTVEMVVYFIPGVEVGVGRLNAKAFHGKVASLVIEGLGRVKSKEEAAFQH
jgi:hypothetical protein